MRELLFDVAKVTEQEVCEADKVEIEKVVEGGQLFDGIARDGLPAALRVLGASVKRYCKGELLLKIGDCFANAGIVLEGIVNESCVTEKFTQITLSHYQTGDYFGIAFAVEKVSSPVQLAAQTDCKVLWINLSSLASRTDPSRKVQNILAANLTHLLAAQNIAVIMRLHVASQPTIHDKLVAYLHTLDKGKDGYYRLPFTQTELAEHLSVNRSALSRELSRMRSTGQLEMRGQLLHLRDENS